MLNILVFGQSFLGKIGGVQQSYAWLYEYLCARGHKITHVSHLPLGEKGLYYPFPEQVDILTLNILFGHDLPEKIRAMANRINPDVILVVNSGMWGLLFCSALRNLPYPVILSERGSPEYCIAELWKSRRLHELGVFNADFFHMLMPSYPQSLPPDLRSRARVISSLTMPAQKTASPDTPEESGRFTILYTGRFSSEKRVGILIKAFALLADKYPLWDLCLVGAGPEQSGMESAVKQHHLEKRVFLPGFASAQELLVNYYVSSHLYCLPSSFEGCPLALREAMAHGLPVIGFASCPGTNEIIAPERNGLLAAHDTAASLAGCLERLMQDPSLRKKMGSSGIMDVRQYAPDKIHGAWEDLLLEAASWKGRRNHLRRNRFLAYPWRYVFTWLQTLSLEKGRRKREVFASSPWQWFSETGIQLLRYGLRNLLYQEQLFKYASRQDILAYRSSLGSGDKTAKSCMPDANLRKAENIASLAMRHGIRLHQLYGMDDDAAKTACDDR